MVLPLSSSPITVLPLPDYLQPGFTPRGSAPPRKSKLPWIIGAVAVVLIVAAVAAVLAA
jgi:hypothetical protein